MENKNFWIIAICILLMIFCLIEIISSLTNESIDIVKCTQNDSTQINQSCRSIQRESFSRKLNLSENYTINDALLNTLIEREKSDNKSLNQVIYLSKLTNETQRINSINELLIINKGFIEKFSSYSQIDDKNKENVEIQLNDYIKDVESKNKFKFDFKSNKITKLFSDNDSKSFVDSLKHF